MGTRHLIAVQIDGAYKIAQYGQWDGYPSGQGAGVLDFLKAWNRPVFEEKLRAASFLTDDDIAALNAKIKAENINWQKEFPELSRDTGSDILSIVQIREAGIKLRNEIDFAGDSLFCEWAYVIDMDANTLEVFKGFNKSPVPEGERFANSPRDRAEYYQVKLAKSYPLDALPTVEQLVKDCDGDCDE